MVVAGVVAAAADAFVAAAAFSAIGDAATVAPVPSVSLVAFVPVLATGFCTVLPAVFFSQAVADLTASLDLLMLSFSSLFLLISSIHSVLLPTS